MELKIDLRRSTGEDYENPCLSIIIAYMEISPESFIGHKIILMHYFCIQCIPVETVVGDI